jgi:hypothetical protein
MVKKYRRKLPATTRINRELARKPEGVSTPIMGEKVKSSTINASIAKNAPLLYEKDIFRDLKWSALVALFIFIIIIILYFTIH